MIDDLAFAKSTLDWTDTQIPSFKEVLQRWANENIYIASIDFEGNPTQSMLVAREREPIPLAFAVEFGAYLNVIRSSLDILACAIARRHGITRMDNVYFPIASSEQRFIDRNFKGKEFIKSLPERVSYKFESLRPYQGGDQDLWVLHNLDVERKHKRLLTVEARPATFQVMGWGLGIVPIQGEVGANGETALCFVSKGADYTDIKMTAAIAVIEPSLGIRQQAGFLLQRFSKKSRSVISMFE